MHRLCTGITFRKRHVNHTASDCGNFPPGKSLETRVCEVNVPCVPDRDCEFEAHRAQLMIDEARPPCRCLRRWDLWGPCSAHCDGRVEGTLESI
eukprot:g33488.t1